MLSSLLLVAGVAAAAATSSQEVPLTDEAQVRDVCTALRGYVPAQDADPAQKVEARNAADAQRAEAMTKSYRVEVPSKGFTFGRYLAQDSRLELDGDRPLKAIEGGILTLDIDGIDDVGFAARAEQVSQWSREKKAGTLKLVVVFKPDGPCAGSAQAQAFRLAGHALSWQLVGSGGPVAAADADGEPAAAGPKSARIERIAMEEEPGVHASDDEGGNERITGVQSALERCASKAQRTGNVVVQFSVQSGHVREPQVIVDSVRDESVSRCVAQALAGAAITGTSASRGTASIALQ